MNTLAIVLLMAVCIQTIRLSGFIAATATIPPVWERTLGYVPIAALSALVTASLTARNEQMSHGIVAAFCAAGISYLTRRTWACIVGGMLVYWLLRLVA